jgi:hypothetical protein
MTWNVYAIKAPVRRLEDLPDHYKPSRIGSSETVIAAISEAAPHVDATDPAWLILNGPDHSMEVSLGKNVSVHEVIFFISGGDGAVGLVLDICRRLGVRPFDSETGALLTATSRREEPAPEPDDAPAENGERRGFWRRFRAGGG